MKNLKLLLCLAALLLVTPMALADDDDCKYTADRQATIDLAGATEIEIDAAAGSLVVTGQAGLSEVSAQGEACASDEDLLDDIQIVTKRSGSRVRVIAKVPESRGGWGSNTARLNLTIEVPADVPLSIDDGSGSIEIKNVAATKIDDGSGEIVASNISGNLEIEDGSGSIRVSEVDGDVRIDDGSGSIDVRNVRGSVIVDEDGSGGIEIADVGHNVKIREDGSGSIDVNEVGGDFTVGRDGSGGVSYNGVSGQVDVPRRRDD